MTREIDVIRRLASIYVEMAQSDENNRHVSMHRAVNDLRGERPIVLISEIPWHEMDITGELALQCRDERLRCLEFYFRTEIYKWRHMRADMVLMPYLPVHKVIHTTGLASAVWRRPTSRGPSHTHTWISLKMKKNWKTAL